LIDVERRGAVYLGGYALVSKQPRHGDEEDESKLKNDHRPILQSSATTRFINTKAQHF
jgi:hypothetical protein